MIAVNAAPVSWTASDSTVLRVIEWGGGDAALPGRAHYGLRATVRLPATRSLPIRSEERGG